jgi:glutamate 5-kinase
LFFAASDDNWGKLPFFSKDIRKAMEIVRMPDWKRAVIKVGSALIAPEGRGCSTKYLLALARFIIESRNQGREVILVSSGAVAAGRGALGERAGQVRRSIPEKQALAAIGQALLMGQWARFFDFPCAQLLLTYDDLANRKRFLNARNTLEVLLEYGTLPIVNENDTVAVEELKLGDNDNLAAHVAVLADADLLIICSDIDGLYDADPRKHPEARHLPVVEKIDEAIYALAGGTGSSVGTGGMRTKIQAADKATARGIHTLILNGQKGDNFEALLNGFMPGTIFYKVENPISAKKHWMLHGLPSTGRIFVDGGAARALAEQGASLLPSGVVGVEGTFSRGEAVTVVADRDTTPRTIAKGITQYGAVDLEWIAGLHSQEIEKTLGYSYHEVVIHRDDLVLMEG